MENSRPSIVIMNESVSETFPNDVIMRVNFATESFYSSRGRSVQAVSPKGSSVILSLSALSCCVCMAHCDALE